MIQMPQVQYSTIALKGGLDQITPTMSLPPGVAKDGINFECALTGGYTRIGGYERFSGQDKPSNATYTILQIASFTNTPSTGDTLTGDSSGATGYVIAVTATYLAVTQVTGTFTVGEDVSVGVTPIGTTETLTTTISSLLDAQYTNAAADVYRADISPITGSGPIRGIFVLDDVTYAFRDNAGGTAVDMWKSSTSGWTQVTFFNEISFTAGNGTEPADGTTLTQGGVTATIKRTCTQSGTAWSGSAAGRFIIGTESGGSFAAGAATIGGTTVTLSGASTAITLTPGGKFHFNKGNLYGSASTIRMYGADSVNRGIEFDGTVLVPVGTSIPKYVVIHKNHLMWMVESSIIHSAPGLPYNYVVADEAGEIAVGDDITGVAVQPGSQNGGALGVMSRNSINILYGSSSSDWTLVTYNQGTGAIDYTTQSMNESYFLDDRGVTNLTTSLNYGNFAHTTLTHNIQTFISNNRSRVACSSVNREKGQYRLFFTDGYALYVTVVNGQLVGSMPMYFTDIMNCAYEGELSNGNVIGLVGGATSGHVYELDVGTSFDGGNIDAYLNLNWDSARSPRIRKRYRRASIELRGNYYAAIGFGYQLSYGTDSIEQPNVTEYASNFSGVPRWDSFSWDSFIWDGRTLTPTECEMNGTGENVQFVLASTSDYIASYTINSIIYHFSSRRGIR